MKAVEKMIDKNLQKYLNQKIIPFYQGFDQAHHTNHVEMVISESLTIATDYDVNLNMVYTIACYHDIGLINNREEHHLLSGQLLVNDSNLTKWFSLEEIQIMKEAVEDHRASNQNEPRSIYGKIVAEADRIIDYETVLTRSIMFSIKHYPGYQKKDHYNRVVNHINQKYGENGYLKLWLATTKNQMGLRLIRQKLACEKQLQSDFDEHYDKIIKRG